MAEIITVTDSEQKVANVSAAVGKNGVNHQNDVMLVKAFLWYLSQELTEIAPRGGVPLPYDGTVSNVAAAIANFQKALNEINKTGGSSARVAVDGRISPLRGSSQYISGYKFWTIFALNFYVELKAKSEGKASGLAAVAEIFPHLKLLFPESAMSAGAK